MLPCCFNIMKKILVGLYHKSPVGLLCCKSLTAFFKCSNEQNEDEASAKINVCGIETCPHLFYMNEHLEKYVMIKRKLRDRAGSLSGDRAGEQISY